MERKTPKICLIAFFLNEAFLSPLSHIKQVITEICPESHSIIITSHTLKNKLIPGNEKDDIIIHSSLDNPLTRIINYFVLNLRISLSILKKSKNTDIFLFFMETGLPLPMFISKFRNKKIIWLFPSSLRKRIEHYRDFPNLFLIPFQSLSYEFTDKIVLYSPNLINEWKLNKYSDKIFIAHEHFINTDIFTTMIPYSKRALLIGYIGRLSKEKGVQNFVYSLPAVIDKQKDLNVLIVGDGPLKEEIESFLILNGLNTCKLAGWISLENIPQYLNMLRLLILPSYTEGMPNIMLEAMACGTPVLANSVGSVPDIIKDNVTGFIMENNSPACIRENIIKSLENPDLERIAMNAKKMVDKEFSFEETVEQWKRLIHNNKQAK
jgi:glycosyltransferase involved in cell wall biosynthesis